MTVNTVLAGLDHLLKVYNERGTEQLSVWQDLFSSRVTACLDLCVHGKIQSTSSNPHVTLFKIYASARKQKSNTAHYALLCVCVYTRLDAHGNSHMLTAV